MQEDFFRTVQSALSADRLSVYGHDGAASAIVMGRYLWNIAICEALYSPLQMFEVVLRNAIHQAMADLYSTDNWYDTMPLAAWGYQQVGDAKNKIAKAGKAVRPGRVVAELHLGFWTSTFEDHYERHTRFLPGGIKKVFPRMPKSLHNRKHIKAGLERIRQLRNRVFHHERVIHWKDLPQQHADVLRTLGWMSPEVADMALKLDRFHETHAAGVDPWVNRLRNHWPASASNC